MPLCVQATILTSKGKSIHTLGLQVACRPFVFSDTPDLELEMFLNYTNSTKYAVSQHQQYQVYYDCTLGKDITSSHVPCSCCGKYFCLVHTCHFEHFYTSCRFCVLVLKKLIGYFVYIVFYKHTLQHGACILVLLATLVLLLLLYK